MFYKIRLSSHLYFLIQKSTTTYETGQGKLVRIRHCSATVWGALSWQVRHEDMRSEELSQSACLFLLQETWLVQSQGHGLTARSRACKTCERRSASQKNEKNVRLPKSTAWEKPRSRASLRDQTYDFPENRKAIE